MVKPLVRFFTLFLFGAAVALASPPGKSHERQPLALARGICIDRQVRRMPPEPGMRIDREDVRLIKRLGFDFVKLLLNPAVLTSGRTLDTASMAHFDRIIDFASVESLPVVVCIHPEDDFKRRVLGKVDEFEAFLGFMTELAHHLSTGWTPEQVAFQLMTEPYGSSLDPAHWNHWERLQQRLWKSVRGAMSRYTLILSGDRVGSIEGLEDIHTVNDDNVLYCFTFYEPHLFTWQGGTWRSGVIPALKNLPYPSCLVTGAERSRLLATIPQSLRATAGAEIDQYVKEDWNRASLAARIDRAVAWQRRSGGRVRLWCAEFGCYQKAASAADRLRYLHDMRSVLEERGIGWAYWSYNETFTIMTPESKPFWPPTVQTPDRSVLRVLLPPRETDH
jgi:endoglucanase